MSAEAGTAFQIGHRVRITQQVPRHAGPWLTSVEGTVLAWEQQKSGSWYAHTKDKKVWVDRLKLRKDNGEEVWLNLDQYSRIEVLGTAASEAHADRG